MPLVRLLAGTILVLYAAACAKPKASASIPMPTPPRIPQDAPDPRVGLRAGWMNAGQAVWNLRLVSTTPPSPQFMDPTTPDEKFINSDLAFVGSYVIQGNFHGFQIWDISQAAHPTLVTAYECPGSQNDVSVYRRLLFVSVESLNGRLDCGGQGVPDSTSPDRMRGVRIFDISDAAHPKRVASVQTCRGSHTHTLVTDPRDTTVVYLYVSGGAPVRSPTELKGCSGRAPEQDPNSDQFRIEVIRVPLAHPEQARVINKPPILTGLVQAPEHGEAAEDIAAAARVAAEARARGAYTATIEGLEYVLPPRFVDMLLDSLVRVRGGGGPPTKADSATLRKNIQAIVDSIVATPPGPNGVRPGPVQCHDITVYPAIGLAAGACAGYGLLLDIRNPANPRRIAAVSDSNFSYWHSATFSDDGTKLLFSDEWGGGLQPRCRKTDKPEWGADAIFTRKDSTLTFVSYYKLPAPQSSFENCVAHNGSPIPIPGRDVMVQGWYQGGISVFDWTDPAHPKEIAYFDRGPMDSTELQGAGSWSAYWYNGYIVSSEIARGLDVLELTPGAQLSQNEIDAAKLARVDLLNVQDQQRFVWAPSFVLARAYLDQLARTQGLAAEEVAAARDELARAEGITGAARQQALTAVATRLRTDAETAADGAKVRTVAATVTALAGAK
ncbi:MAG TPA: hypothetical protein VLV16_00080 [Gemmatimonadales bacterium]|nr:hypothetical protein [Gemmatimonadales bacterium]